MKPTDTAGHKVGEVILTGIGVTPTLAIGPAFVIGELGLAVPEYSLAATEVAAELQRLQAGIAKTQRQITQLQQKAAALPADAAREIVQLLDAYKGMLSNSRLIRGAMAAIQTDHLNAEAAIQRQLVGLAASFAAMDDAYLAARGSDVQEVGARLLRNLLEQSYNPFADAPSGSILIADEITPADTALMNPDRIAGFVAVLGGAEGHVAIMARALGLGAVLGAAGATISGLVTGDTVIVDGTTGTVIYRPTPTTLKIYRQTATRLARAQAKLDRLKDLPAITKDGITIQLAANLELPREAERAIAAGADSIGLLRTEFMFMNRPDLPDEDEQFIALRDLVKVLDGRLLTVRTLDVGGEKLATALTSSVGVSDNPALGLRAIRLGLKEPKLLDTQLAAILRAAACGPVRILLPMISSVAQMQAVRKRLVQVERKLRKRGVKLATTLPPLGAMIEIPGAALVADALTKVCDFFAIGSNDLTQYTLAIDRGDDRVADLYDPYHPAVLRLIEFTIAAARLANIPVSLCGELAGEPKATAMLLGYGLRDFSMSPGRLLPVKQRIREVDVGKGLNF